MFNFFREQMSKTSSEKFDSFSCNFDKMLSAGHSLNLSPICIALTIALSFSGEMNHLAYCSFDLGRVITIQKILCSLWVT